MGGCYTCLKYMCCPPKVEALHIIDDAKDPHYGIGFSKSLFQPFNEFYVIKAFCNKKGINQTDLNHLFNIYLTDEKVYVREFR